jgi:membrane-bound lytic murein transglycosylase B
MAQGTMTPSAPACMSSKAQKQWQAAYEKALAQAKLDSPDNPSAQNAAALKAANALLAVPAPTCHADIDKLEDWQKILDETRVIKSVPHRVCVTTDGRKYAFPIPAGK